MFYTLLGTMGPKSENPGIAELAKSVVQVAAFGTLMHWYRAAEYSADRAGLICVGGRVDVAQQALARLLHQTRQSNPLMDEANSKFDMKQLSRDNQDLRHRPMVQLFSLLYEFSATHPFIPDRCAEIANWAMSDEYAGLMKRPAKQDLRLEVTSITIDNIPAMDVYVPVVDSGETDPIARVTYAGQEFSTRRENDCMSVSWEQLDFRFDYKHGAGLILDLDDYNTILPNRFVGSVRLPIDNSEPGVYTTTGKLLLDIDEPSTIVDVPSVKMTYRIEKVESARPKAAAE